MADNIEKIPVQFLVSAGEASSDMYAAGVIDHLSRKIPDLDFYGCAGPKLQAAGVRPVIMASDLAVVGLAEVVTHLPRIYGKFLELANYAEQHPPVAALLTDSPDFHLRLATRLKRIGVPVFYLVAPQVWAWRQSRVRKIRRLVDSLFCLFPFEEKWFRERGVNATYIGHPLAFMARPGAFERRVLLGTAITGGSTVDHSASRQPRRRGLPAYASSARCGKSSSPALSVFCDPGDPKRLRHRWSSAKFSGTYVGACHQSS